MTRKLGWRSTTLRVAEKHCPRALDYYERDAPYDRSVFSVGVAAHAILEDVGKASSKEGRAYYLPQDYAKVVEETCRRLIEVGRGFEGHPEPPLPSDAVWAGRDLAVAYLSECPLPPSFEYEVGVAVNRDWQLCPYHRDAWLGARIDAVGTVLPAWQDAEDDGISGPILEVRDYKSAWSATADELRSIQRKIQAVLSWKKWGANHEALRVVIVNFRMGREFDLLVMPHEPEGQEVLACWQRDIEIEIEARESQVGEDGWRPASPGPQCMGCPYLGQCSEAQSLAASIYGGETDPRELARIYSVHLAAAEVAEKGLRFATAEEPIDLGEYIVGTLPKTQQALMKDAPEKLAEVWLRRMRDASPEQIRAAIPGLLSMLGLGVSQAKSLLSKLYKGGEEERERRAKILATVLTKKTARTFGIHKKEKKA